MADAPLLLIEPLEDRKANQSATLPPSDYPLHLLLDEQNEDLRAHWAVVLAGSLAIHIVVFFGAVRLPALVARTEPATRRVIVHHVPLYLPRDILTQKARNNDKVSKKIDLAQLLADQPEQRARAAAPAPSVKRFELPATSAPKKTLTDVPKILPDAPAVAVNQPPPQQLPSGAINGLPIVAPPPPTSTPGPFQNIGDITPPDPQHPKLAPPKATVDAAVNDLAKHQGGSQVIISDDSPGTTPSPGVPGLPGQVGARHAAVELQSDPQGADFKPYLTRILAIVRANWRVVIPQSVRMGTLRGRTVMEFVINRDGSIPKMVTSESSGLDPLDRAAVAGLSMSNPLPPLPADFKGQQVRLAFSFSYNMPSQ
jgi:TonB family protein